MVAYNFKQYFAPQIEDGTKLHTIRSDRSRHARPGEAVQLFVGMRTRYCRKVIPDPVCVAVLPIVIVSTDLIAAGIAYIEIDGTPLHRDEIEPFAASDGFSPERLCGLAPAALIGATARETMGRFWRASHPTSRFVGVIVNWLPEIAHA